MHVASMRVELRIPGVRSLKAKRRVLKSITDRIGRSRPVAIAEVDHLDLWQRATLGIAVVSSTPGQVDRMLHALERELSDRDDVELLARSIAYLEEPE
jgi:uncharacterized protein YlxP (DUF503 family)